VARPLPNQLWRWWPSPLSPRKSDAKAETVALAVEAVVAMNAAASEANATNGGVIAPTVLNAQRKAAASGPNHVRNVHPEANAHRVAIARWPRKLARTA
jgi:hypothetical protein